MNRKGTELSLNVIIIAAVGLLILVILAFLVINSTRQVPDAQKKCNPQGGLCQAQCTTGTEITASDCGGNTPVCCKPFG